MGGTSTDVCLIDGTAKVTKEGSIGGLPLRGASLRDPHGGRGRRIDRPDGRGGARCASGRRARDRRPGRSATVAGGNGAHGDGRQRGAGADPDRRLPGRPDEAEEARPPARAGGGDHRGREREHGAGAAAGERGEGPRSVGFLAGGVRRRGAAPCVRAGGPARDEGRGGAAVAGDCSARWGWCWRT
jgi:hypothetical protein